MQNFSVAIKGFFESLYNPECYLYRWLHGEAFSLEPLNAMFGFWPIIAVACLVMLICGFGFMIGGRFRRGILAVLSSVFYAAPIAVLLLSAPAQAIDNAAIATFSVAIVWFFIGNCLLYRTNFFIRLIASYVHFLLLMFPGLIASDTSPTASLITVWGIAVAFHVFVFIIPYLPDRGGSDDGFGLNDMIGDEFDDDWVQGI